jgi:hypothetical protein
MKNVGSILPINVYPHLEQLLGYPGNHRFVVFDLATTTGVSFNDGTIDGQCAPDGWHAFTGFPLIAQLLAKAHLSGADEHYCLLFDREKRQLFSFLKTTAEKLLLSDKNREVASEGMLVEKLEGLFGLKGNLDLVERKELSNGSSTHFTAWMVKNSAHS